MQISNLIYAKLYSGVILPFMGGIPFIMGSLQIINIIYANLCIIHANQRIIYANQRIIYAKQENSLQTLFHPKPTVPTIPNWIITENINILCIFMHIYINRCINMHNLCKLAPSFMQNCTLGLYSHLWEGYLS